MPPPLVPGAARRGLVQRQVARWAAARSREAGWGWGVYCKREVLKDYNGLRASPSRPPPPSCSLPSPLLRPPPPRPPPPLETVPQETFSRQLPALENRSRSAELPVWAPQHCHSSNSPRPNLPRNACNFSSCLFPLSASLTLLLLLLQRLIIR